MDRNFSTRSRLPYAIVLSSILSTIICLPFELNPMLTIAFAIYIGNEDPKGVSPDANIDLVLFILGLGLLMVLNVGMLATSIIFWSNDKKQKLLLIE